MAEPPAPEPSDDAPEVEVVEVTSTEVAVVVATHDDIEDAVVVEEVVEQEVTVRSLAPTAPRRFAEPEAAATDDVVAPTPPAVPELDGAALVDARALVAARPELGRLGPLLIWLAGVQGASPPRPFTFPVALVVGARHEAARYVGRFPAELVARRLAETASDLMPVRTYDLGGPGDWYVRDASGPIQRENALTADEALRAFALGRLAVDREVDGGADLLLVGDAAVDSGPASAALVAAATDGQAQRLVGRSGLATDVWVRTVEVVRDARARAKPVAAQALPLLAAAGGADHAFLAGALVQAARRETPVLLSGVAAHVAGLAAETYAEGSSLWWTSASASGDPAEDAAITALELDPLLSLDLGLDRCGAGFLAYGLLQQALAQI